ncbi:MAG: hypothetical protein KDI88_08325 [Gammaproteobacteria bacterium]|nr:hypothetical protein [Gammaproteobacteria bacterium]
MKRPTRQHRVECGADLASQLGHIVAAYAEAAYPPGGSECGQVAREALLDTSRLCLAHDGGELALPKRQLAMLRAAVDWAGEQANPFWSTALQVLVGRKREA